MFLDRPHDYIGARRDSRSRADYANPFRKFDDDRVNTLGHRVVAWVSVALCAVVAAMAWFDLLPKGGA